MKRLRSLHVVGLVLAFVTGFSSLLTAQQASLAPAGLNPLHESTAYQRYCVRDKSEFSKILYLIDRFAAAEGQIIYDGIAFQPRAVAPLARWYLYRFYRNETAEKWVKRHCYRSLYSNELIWFRSVDGEEKLAHDLLMSELEQLKNIQT